MENLSQELGLGPRFFSISPLRVFRIEQIQMGSMLMNELIFLLFSLNKKICRPFGTNNFINTYMNIKKEPLFTAGILNFRKGSL